MIYTDRYVVQIYTFDEVPKALAESRAKRGLSSTEAASFANISQSQYIRIESGQSGYRVQTLEDICCALGLILDIKVGIKKDLKKKKK